MCVQCSGLEKLHGDAVLIFFALPVSAAFTFVVRTVRANGEDAARGAERGHAGREGVQIAGGGGETSAEAGADADGAVSSALGPVVPFACTHSDLCSTPLLLPSPRLQVSHKADQSSIDRIVFDNSDEIEKIVRSYESKSAHDSKVQAAYLSDVRLQIEEMQNYQNQVDQKLQMALKFIDWFTDVKMKHM